MKRSNWVRIIAKYSSVHCDEPFLMSPTWMVNDRSGVALIWSIHRGKAATWASP